MLEILAGIFLFLLIKASIILLAASAFLLYEEISNVWKKKRRNPLFFLIRKQKDRRLPNYTRLLEMAFWNGNSFCKTILWQLMVRGYGYIRNMDFPFREEMENQKMSLLDAYGA